MASPELQFGRYLLLERIAAGGMGEVWVGLQTGIGEFRRPVAVKLLLPHLSDDPHIISMFLREARLAAQMQSAHVAQVYDVGFEHDRYFIAMELVRGVSLSKLIAGLKGSGRQLNADQLSFIARGLCDGLHVAHEQRGPDGEPLGVVHRDVTPHNVLVSVDGAVKLTDFGIARVAEGDNQSKPGVVMGKLGYLSPEQLRGEALDRRVDVFAAGATLYHLAALEKPFDTPTGQLLDAGRLPRAPLRVYRPDLPRELIDAIEKAMAMDLSQRFATARELRLALPEPAPGQDEVLGALVRETCGAALVDLEHKTQRATLPINAEALTRSSPQKATPAPKPERAVGVDEPSLSYSSVRPSRLPLVLGALGLAVGVVALSLTLGARGGEAVVPERVVDAGVAAVALPTPLPEPVLEPLTPLTVLVPVDAGVVRAAPARLSVDASPWGQVWVDGKAQGDTPVSELKLNAGEHQLRVMNPETGKSSSQRLVLKPGEHRTLRVDLR